MNLPVVFLPEPTPTSKPPSTDLKITGKAFGVEFMTAVDAHLTRVSAFLLLAPVYLQTIRRQVMRGFSYGIFYEPHAARIIVIAILDLRQNPERIRQRLQ